MRESESEVKQRQGTKKQTDRQKRADKNKMRERGKNEQQIVLSLTLD